MNTNDVRNQLSDIFQQNVKKSGKIHLSEHDLRFDSILTIFSNAAKNGELTIHVYNGKLRIEYFDGKNVFVEKDDFSDIKDGIRECLEEILIRICSAQ